jgi:hypothetical protein
MCGPMHRTGFWPQNTRLQNEPNPIIGQSPPTTELPLKSQRPPHNCLPHPRAPEVGHASACQPAGRPGARPQLSGIRRLWASILRALAIAEATSVLTIPVLSLASISGTSQTTPPSAHTGPRYASPPLARAARADTPQTPLARCTASTRDTASGSVRGGP